jgi:BirA family biotin operon repressor/biotin-[acetyl-CoA-carboxylase] ligase
MPLASPTPAIVRLGQVDSTQRVAFALASAGAPDRTVVVADVQTAGRGRRGRAWHAEAGTSLLASIVVRPRLAPWRLPTLSIAAAVAVAEAVARVTGVEARLKWPNDVVVGGRKLAGILLESRSDPAPVVVIGVGVNLRQRAFPEPLASRATSVALEGGRALAPDVVLAAVLEDFDAVRTLLEAGAFDAVRARWLARADVLRRPVKGARGSAQTNRLDRPAGRRR